MKLSVVIVSYNVKYHLEQCIRSVIKASDELEADIWVVDNASSDGSVEYLQAIFPDVHFISKHLIVDQVSFTHGCSPRIHRKFRNHTGSWCYSCFAPFALINEISGFIRNMEQPSKQIALIYGGWITISGGVPLTHMAVDGGCLLRRQVHKRLDQEN